MLPHLPREGCSWIPRNGALAGSYSPGRVRAEGSGTKWEEYGLKSNQDDVPTPAPLPTWGNGLTTSEMQTVRLLKSLTNDV